MTKLFKNALALTLSLCSVTVLAQKAVPFTIEGDLQGLKDNSYVFLSHKWNDDIKTDSVLVKGTKFKFKGTSPEPNMYWIYDSPKSQQFLIFFVDKGDVKIKGDVKQIADAEVKAGLSQKDYMEYRAILKGFDAKKTELGLEYQTAQQSGNQAKMQEVQMSYGNLVTDQNKLVDEFVATHSKSVVAGYAIWASTQEEPDLVKLEKNYNLLSDDVKKSKFGKIVADKIASVKGSMVGYPIMEFSQSDADGKPVSISSFKGKVVLVDFWASWCGPCRAENPNVVKAYNAFKGKGFDILGVSFDSTKDKWLKAIEKDNLTWTQVSDLKGWSNAVGQQFGIRSIPQNFLLDKEGKIIAKNLRGEDLYAKLEEILK
ncbi:MAG: hypothetical protein K0S33_3875 [Bacteroidetes bacterium]|jgi:peroxiredoxin|nr:hypothetical protein [Bacteroidota bacterium]